MNFPIKMRQVLIGKLFQYINKLSDNYNKDIKLFTELGSKCKRCEFRASEEETKGI